MLKLVIFELNTNYLCSLYTKSLDVETFCVNGFCVLKNI